MDWRESGLRVDNMVPKGLFRQRKGEFEKISDVSQNTDF
jgi:hypothetical protein